MSEAVAVITGGDGDLARGIKRELLGVGYRVRSPGHAELDVTSSTCVESWFESLEQIDLLINNAGITGDGIFLRQDGDDWNEVLDTNLKGAHLCSQAAAIRMMRQRDGHIVNIGSYSGLHPPIGQTSYAASKAGLIGLTKSYARELGKRNIRVNCVLPGFLETKMTEGLPDEAKEAARKRHQLGRFNTIEEAARFITHLAGTHHISGQVFQLDSRT